MTKQISLKFSLLLAVVGLVFWVFYILKYVFELPLFLAAEDGIGLSTQILFLVYGYLTLVVGVILGAVYKELKLEKSRGRRRIKIAKVLRGSMQTPEFWMGIFASPVLYVILLQAVNLDSITIGGFIAVTLVGLQNGFVCNSIADALFEKSPTLNPDSG